MPEPVDRPTEGAPLDEVMARALALGDAVRRTTAPNPWVGCVLVRDGESVAEGSTAAPGGPHAEIAALTAAGDKARGATAFVTLEPCSHHGRTGPCADALIAAGVSRVVIALEDPDENVRGRGLARLREHGVAVEVGLCAESARRSLAPYLHHRRTGRAYCLVKTALSLDGRTAAADGSSRWITGPAARGDAHELRADSQAVVVGAGTAVIDHPALTVRGARVVQPPLRVVLDARGRVAAEGPLFDVTLAPTLVLTTELVRPGAVDDWRAAGAKVEVLPASAGGIDLVAALETLGSHGVLQAMIEGGPTLQGALIQEGLVDRIVAYVAPTVLGRDARPGFEWPGPATLTDATRWRLTGARQLEDDVRLDYEPTDETVSAG